jgi:tetratricopeptide (TPR) repeat protein
VSNLANAQSLFFSALNAQEKGDLDAAERLYREALVLAPGRPSIVKNLAAVLFELKKLDDACALCTQHLESHPADALLWTQLGNTRLGMAQFEQALESYTTALRYTPDHPETLINTAYAMEGLGRSQDALLYLDRLIELAPGNAAALGNRGNVLTKLNRFDDALRDYQHAQRIEPASPMAYWNESICRLFSGDLDGGWKLYDWGWQAGQRGKAKPAFAQPAWNGRDLVNRLLVWGEQGIGDQILFSSMLDDLRNHAKHVVVATEKRLLPLFRRSFPDFDVIDINAAATLNQVDQQTALGDLGMHLRKNWRDFPKNRKKILAPDPARVQILRKRLGSGENLGKNLICGFSWSSTNPRIGPFKSLAEADLSALGAIPGIRWVDLQYGDTRGDRMRFMDRFGFHIDHLDDIDNFNDMDGLAALTGACDLVVTVSNTTAHLAGALGVPTMVMLPHGIGRLWYWHHDQASSPWYPSCRLIRQSTAGDWAPVIAGISAHITALAKRSGHQ